MEIINLVIWPLAILGIIFIIMLVINFVTNVISKSKTQADEQKAIKKFCRENNYCYFGCGGGQNHDSSRYYGGYYCASDHK